MPVRDEEAAGATVVWTVHNGLAHEAEFERAEVELARRLAEVADVVHVLSAATRDYVAPWYELPAEKVVHLPHPSYKGMYDRSVSRAEARTALGLREQDKAVLFFGQIRAYKGVDTVVAAAAAARARDEDVVLLLAGHTHDSELAKIDALLPAGLRTVRHHDFVRDADVQTWLTAADVLVLPYQRILNSGSMFLGATFGLPVVLPRQPHLESEFGDEPWVHLYDASASADQLGAFLLDVVAGDVDAQRDAALAFAARYTPYELSTDYLDLLRSR